MTEVNASDLLAVLKSTPMGRLKYDLLTAETSDEYLNITERALRLALIEVVSNRRHRQTQAEDDLNTEIVSLMRFAGLTVFHDVKYGGHTDISVRMGAEFLWIAEAKLWTGCSWAFSGLKQLGRYMSGLKGQKNGAIILYVRSSDAHAELTKWFVCIKKLSTRLLTQTLIVDLAFKTTHKHLGAGTIVEVEHIAVPLYWNGKSSAV